MPHQGLAEHIGTVVTITGGLAVIVAWFGSRTLKRIEEKLDEYQVAHVKCQASLPDRFADKVETSAKLAEISTKQTRLREELIPILVTRQQMENGLDRIRGQIKEDTGHAMGAINAKLEVLIQLWPNRNHGNRTEEP